jgi:hypothetical protein
MILKITPNVAKPFDCTKSGISRCHGDCCIKLRSYWPPRAYQFGCEYLSNVGCTLSIQDRPIDCLIYPLFINHKGTLQIHNHCYHKKWMCNPNMGVGEKKDSAGHTIPDMQPFSDRLKEKGVRYFFMPGQTSLLNGVRTKQDYLEEIGIESVGCDSKKCLECQNSCKFRGNNYYPKART